MSKPVVDHILDCPSEPPHEFCNEVKPIIEAATRVLRGGPAKDGSWSCSMESIEALRAALGRESER